MSIASARAFWDRAKKDKAFYDEVFGQGGSIVVHMERIMKMGYDFTKW